MRAAALGIALPLLALRSSLTTAVVGMVWLSVAAALAVRDNIRAILQPPLRENDRKKIAELFGNLVGVGLDEVSPLR